MPHFVAFFNSKHKFVVLLNPVINSTKMKKSFILLNIFFCFQFVFSQETWQEATKIADSLQFKFKFDKVVPYRNIAIDKAIITQKDSLKFLTLLKEISIQELDISDNELRNVAYKNLQRQIKELELMGAKPERLYQAYRRLYIFAHNYMRSMKDTEVYIKKSIEHHFNCKKIDSFTLLKTMHSSGVISRELGLFKNAITTFTDAEKFYHTLKIKDTNMLGSIYTDLANTYHSKFLNIPKKRMEYLKKSESVFLQLKNPNYDYLISLYIRFSDNEKNIGNFEDAIGYLKKGLKINSLNKGKAQNYRMGKIGYKRELQFYHYLIQIYSQTNNEKEILTQLNEIQKIRDKAKKLDAIETDFISLSYLFASRYYRKKENYDTSLSFINKGLSLNNENHEENLEADFLLEKVNIFTAIKKYKEAEILIKQLENLEKTPIFIKKNIIESACTLYLKQNNKEQAYIYLNKSINWLNNQSNETNLKKITHQNYISSPVLNDANFLLSLAEHLEKSNLNEPKDVETLYWLSLKQFKDNFKNQFLNDKLNKTYTKISAYFFDKLIKKELSTIEKERFVSFTENIDARFSLNKFYDNNNILSSNKSDSLINKEQFIRSNITFLKKKNLDKKSDSLKQLIFEENLKLKSILGELKNFNEGYVHLSDTKSYKKNLIALKNNYIIKYKIFENQLFRTVFFQDNIEISKINNYDNLKKSIEEYLLMIKNRTTSIATIKEKGTFLYQALFENLDLKNNHKIYIIPDAILYYLPFELLVENENYLIKTKDISYASSLTFLQTPTTPKKDNDLVLFAPSYKMFKPNELQLAVRGEPYSLSGTLEEVKSISKIHKSTLFINEQATKKVFKNLSNKYAIIHLSMHSFLNDEDSELNSLVFSDNNDDYEMYISELFGLHLNADLVVLSACNTGVGNLKTGKGMVSMSNAFTYAGIPSTISSLWSAPDLSTKEIMVDFYKNLKNKETFSKSLRNAKLNYLKNVDDVELTHPYYWAGFVLYGNDQSIDLNNGNFVYLKWIGILLLLGIILFILKKYKN